MLKKCIAALFIFLFCFFPKVDGANAQEESALPFNVTPILTKEQSKDVESYFDINVKPSKDYTLKAKVENTINKPLTLHIDVANAYTASNGGIVYSPLTNENKNDIIDPRYELSNKVVVTPDKITLKGGEAKTISIKVHVPDIKSGTVLGGLLFSTDKQEISNTKKGNSNFLLSNKANFAIAIKLNIGENNPSSDLTISKSIIEYTPTGPKINVTMTNKSAKILKGIKVSYAVKQEKKQLFTGNFDLSKVAPMSKVESLIPWQTSSPKKGEYQMDIKATVDGNVFKKTFDMKVKNNNVVIVQEGKNNPIPKEEGQYTFLSSPFFFILIGILITVVILLLHKFLPFLIRRRKHET